jgi:excisionase family DNA binding protein
MSVPVSAAPAPLRPRYLSTATVAARLGLSPPTIRDWAERGVLPAFRLGKQWRVEERSLEEWLQEQILRSVNEARREALRPRRLRERHCSPDQGRSGGSLF